MTAATPARPTSAPAPAPASTAVRVKPVPTSALPSADEAAAHALLNCLVREVCGPVGNATVRDGQLLLRLPASGVRLRVAVRRSGRLGDHRLTGPVRTHAADGAGTPSGSGIGGREIGIRELGQIVAAELTARTGESNPEFTAQLASSRTGMAIGLAARAAAEAVAADVPDTEDGPLARYLASERSLVLGHRFHPAPKARGADRHAWAAWAPETGAAFPLRLLAVREDRVAQECAAPGAAAALDRAGAWRAVPDCYRALPAHPWQFALLRELPRLRRAFAEGEVLDLGAGGPSFAPTASVRTLYGDGGFLKFSLNVRITNCLRKNASYELSGAVALTRTLRGVLDALAVRHPGTAVLREPAYRSMALPGQDGLPDRELLEGFGVIVREGFGGLLRPGVTPLLAAAVADPYPSAPVRTVRAALGRSPAAALDWWRRYLRLLLPPVLTAFTEYGVVLEPHLQNVVIGVGGDGLPRQVLLRDLEGTKLLADRHRELLAALPADVAGPVAYDEPRGWDRVVYCLLVNNAAEILAVIADRHPALEGVLWGEVHDALREFAAGAGGPRRIGELLAGAPLPAKANLLTRWARHPDRAAGYVRLPSPLKPLNPLDPLTAGVPPQTSREPSA